ncbi:hypothetical protein IAR50_001781 [Cryptococcus sp. DSM 104548]
MTSSFLPQARTLILGEALISKMALHRWAYDFAFYTCTNPVLCFPKAFSIQLPTPVYDLQRLIQVTAKAPTSRKATKQKVQREMDLEEETLHLSDQMPSNENPSIEFHIIRQADSEWDMPCEVCGRAKF